jgi:hypothetical protein
LQHNSKRLSYAAVVIYDQNAYDTIICHDSTHFLVLAL